MHDQRSREAFPRSDRPALRCRFPSWLLAQARGSAEVETLLGDATRARQDLGWTPKISFAELVDEMMRADLVLATREKASPGQGLKIYRPDLEGG